MTVLRSQTSVNDRNARISGTRDLWGRRSWRGLNHKSNASSSSRTGVSNHRHHYHVLLRHRCHSDRCTGDLIILQQSCIHSAANITKKVPCIFEITIPGLGYLEGNSNTDVTPTSLRTASEPALTHYRLSKAHESSSHYGLVKCSASANDSVQ